MQLTSNKMCCICALRILVGRWGHTCGRMQGTSDLEKTDHGYYVITCRIYLSSCGEGIFDMGAPSKNVYMQGLRHCCPQMSPSPFLEGFQRSRHETKCSYISTS